MLRLITHQLSRSIAFLLALIGAVALLWRRRSQIALYLYILRTLYAICLPRGLAAVHFRWPEHNLVLLRTQLDRLTWVFVPSALVVNLAIDLDPAETGGTLARLALLAGYAALSWFLYRVFHPKCGVLAYLQSGGEYPLVFRTYLLWYPLFVIYPMMLVSLAFMGYMYSATSESYMFLYTLWLVLVLVLVNALALRWLRLTRRRLAFDAALERRRAAQEAAQAEVQELSDEAGELQFEEPEVDITALSDETRGLIRVLVIVLAVGGFYLIWASALPALRIFEDVTLWQGAVTVDGEDRNLPITLADLDLALLYAVGTWILAARLPAMLKIFLIFRQQHKTLDHPGPGAVIRCGLLNCIPGPDLENEPDDTRKSVRAKSRTAWSVC